MIKNPDESWSRGDNHQGPPETVSPTPQPTLAGEARVLTQKFHDKLFECVFRDSNDAYFIIDPETHAVLDANRTAQVFTGLQKDEICQRPLDKLLHSPRDEHMDELTASYQSTGFFHSREGYFLWRQGQSPMPVNVTVSRIHADDQNVGLVVMRDITERRQAEMAMAERERLSRLSADLGALLTSAETLVQMQQQAVQLLADGWPALAVGYWEASADAETLLLRAFAGLSPLPAQAPEKVVMGEGLIGQIGRRVQPFLAYPLSQHVAAANHQWVSTHKGLAFAGFPLWVEPRLVGVLGVYVAQPFSRLGIQSLGTMAGLMAVGLERKITENALLESKITAEAANQAKSDFLANISHEIRTPMTAILGFADVIIEHREPVLPQPIRSAAQTIYRNGQHLLEIINDILDLSKIEAGKLSVETERFALPSFLGDVMDLMKVRAEPKGLALVLEFEGPVPEFIETDPTRLRQILINLLGNAVKFTEKGSVTLRCGMAQNLSGTYLLRFAVIDTGIGMTADQQRGLFRPFSQVDDSAHRKAGGTGLGLVISRRLAQMLGGDIQLQSQPQEGSTFTLTVQVDLADPSALIRPTDSVAMPAHRVDDSSYRESSSVDILLGRHILLAEDGADNRRLIRFHLDKAGISLSEAQNGKEAVGELTQLLTQGKPVDAILMDMQMPVMDGYDATRRIREAGYTGPIIALTAHAMAGDRQKCLDAGCDDYVSKPIDRKRLLATLREALIASMT